MTMGIERLTFDDPFVEKIVEDDKRVYIFDKQNYARILLHNLIAMQENNDRGLTDVIIISKDDKQFHFHAPILAALSEKLEEILLQQGPAHATSKKPKIIKETFTSEAVQCLWDYAYKSAVILTPSNITEMKEMAEHYGLENLKEECKMLEEERFQGDYDVVKLEFKNLPEFISERLYTLLRASKFCSAVITGSEPSAKIPCHRAVIAATCSVLSAELTQGDSDGDTSESIQVYDTTFQVMAPFLRYLYTARLMVEPAKVQQLLEMAVTFNLPGMEHACCCWLEDALTPDNALGIMEIAQTGKASNIKNSVHQYNALEDLYQSAKRFALNNFVSVQENAEYLGMSLKELSSLINDDNLVVNSEEDVFHAVLKWVEFDPETRAVELPHLLQSVRLEHLSIGFLDTILEHDLVKKNSLCVELIQKALQDSLQQSYPPKYDTEDRDIYDSSLPDDFNQLFESQPVQDTAFARKPDMRLRRNREAFLERGKNIDGTPDKRLRENKTKSSVARKLTYSDEELPKRKDGQLDGRFKVVKVTKDATLKLLPEGPKRKDGQPDMRFKANRYPTKGILCTGPKRKDGQPDMRYSANKQKVDLDYQTPRREASTAGPKKNGTSDMRFAEKKKAEILVSSSVPLKKDGTPDMRFTVNKRLGEKQPNVFQGPRKAKANQTPDMQFPASNTFAGIPESGPLKKDGTPDMRYRSNQRSSSVGVGSGSSGSYVSSNASSSSPRLKKDGTPDMRYKCNKSSSSSSSSSFGSRSSTSSGRTTSFSSSGYSGSSHVSSSCGPLKKDGTPDMRYKANRR